MFWEFPSPERIVIPEPSLSLITRLSPPVAADALLVSVVIVSLPSEVIRSLSTDEVVVPEAFLLALVIVKLPSLDARRENGLELSPTLLSSKIKFAAADPDTKRLPLFTS